MEVQDIIEKASAKDCLKIMGWHKVKRHWTDGRQKMTEKEFRVLCAQITNTSKKTNVPPFLVIGLIMGL